MNYQLAWFFAMPAAVKKGQINLLPQEEFKTTTLGRVLTWLTSTFRIIVIATEALVMIAFLSRFWLDARVSDLNDEIKQKQAMVAAYSDFEAQFRKVQQKITILAEIASDQKSYSDKIKKIASFLPADVRLSSISLKQGDIRLVGTSSTENSIAQLYTNLSSDPDNAKVSINQVAASPEDETALDFVITISSLADKVPTN